MPTGEFSFAHLTDTHVTDEASSKLVECAFQEINNLRPRPDFVVIGGDLVANGTRAEFDVFLRVFEKLQPPVYTLCGNHDLIDGESPIHYQRHFGDLCYAFDHNGYHCIALDTTHRDYETYGWHGCVQPEVRDWLKWHLDTVPPDKPILLFTHQGLVGSREDLSCDVENADEVLGLLEGHHLVAGFSGHAHRLRCHEWKGTPFFVNAALSSTHENLGGEPPGFFVVKVRDGRVSVAYHLVCKT